MAVAVDATGTALETSGQTTPLNYTGLTVGSINASSPGLLVVVSMKTLGTAWSGQSPTLNWDQLGTPQALTLIGRGVDSVSNNLTIELWGRIGTVTAGNKQLSYAWTGGGSADICVTAISLTGVNQTSFSAAFPSARFQNSGSVSSVGPASVAIPSAVGDMAFMAFAAINFDDDPLTVSPSGAVEWTKASTFINNESYRAPGTATVTYTGTTFGGVQPWCMVGCDVVAAPTIGTTTFHYNMGVNI